MDHLLDPCFLSCLGLYKRELICLNKYSPAILIHLVIVFGIIIIASIYVFLNIYAYMYIYICMHIHIYIIAYCSIY